MKQRPHFNPEQPRELRKSYEELKAKHGENWGLQPMEDPARTKEFRGDLQRRHLEGIEAEWDRRGVEPPRLCGIVVSPELAKQLNLKTGPKAEPKEKNDVTDAA